MKQLGRMLPVMSVQMLIKPSSGGYSNHHLMPCYSGFILVLVVLQLIHAFLVGSFPLGSYLYPLRAILG